jgi:hypothetical protein
MAEVIAYYRDNYPVLRDIPERWWRSGKFSQAESEARSPAGGGPA